MSSGRVSIVNGRLGKKTSTSLTLLGCCCSGLFTGVESSGSSPSPPRTYYLGTGALKRPLRPYYLGTWGARAGYFWSLSGLVAAAGFKFS